MNSIDNTSISRNSSSPTPEIQTGRMGGRIVTTLQAFDGIETLNGRERNSSSGSFSSLEILDARNIISDLPEHSPFASFVAGMKEMIKNFLARMQEFFQNVFQN